ncbi:DUF3073 domain-containing protein [Galbitalea sp. SE-J8]|uniref:DUF3073 domain-containing protein n=1 Tax=Galbitalea sp. SE-J8 TaxID=3054952 RepID=UPI00259C9CAE|nr:DUF3073 domain-containing protein [Galbitalea sp. SE-J8]MDM4762228.1 DUF3073 domain-containing protein [Galbitalea sp. SE-J8]
MGRGRQKAKHTKVARELKYFSPDTNYGALEKELGTPGGSHSGEWPEYEDPHADEYDDDTDEDETESDDSVPEHRTA